jgi:putative transposase
MKDKLESAEYNELEKKLYNNTSLMLSDTLHNKLKLFEKYTNLYNFLKNEKVYKNLSCYYSVLPQQVLRCVESAWSSYFKLLEKWNTDLNYQMNFNRPNMPRIRKTRKEYMLKIPGEFLNNERMAKGIVRHFQNSKKINSVQKRNGKVINKHTTYELKLPPIFQSHFKNFPLIQTTINDISQIIEVRIIPETHYYMFEIVYVKDKPEADELDPSRALAIDFGVNNLATMVTNFGTIPLIIRGRLLKSHNQYVSKISKLFQQQYHCETLGMSMIRRKREAFIDYFLHKASHLIIEYCREQHISKIAIGYNTLWKSEINMTRRNNMNFYSIPHLKLVNLIKYKAELLGIEVRLVNEAHTSKCSALDFEPIEHHDLYLGTRGITLKGLEKKYNIIKGSPEYKTYNARGLFRSKDGFIIHSDINGAFNIGRRAFPELFNPNTMTFSIRNYIELMEIKNANNENYLALMHILKKMKSESNVEESQEFVFLRKVMMMNPRVIPIDIILNRNYNFKNKKLGEPLKIKNEKTKYDSTSLDRFKYP